MAQRGFGLPVRALRGSWPGLDGSAWSVPGCPDSDGNGPVPLYHPCLFSSMVCVESGVLNPSVVS